ncbi:MAG: DUF4173 domain-containing protein [Pseudomonadota bacterium]
MRAERATIDRAGAEPREWAKMLPAIAVLGVVLAADLLLWRSGEGLAWATFLGAVLTAIWLVTGASASVRRPWHPHHTQAALVTVLTLIPVIEHPSALSLAMAGFGAGMLSLILSGGLRQTVCEALADAPYLWLAGPFWLIRDLRQAGRHLPRRGMLAEVQVWAVPALLGALFLMLFVEANPILGTLAAQIDLAVVLREIDGWRIFFWALTAGLIWGVLRPPHRARTQPEPIADSPVSAALGAPQPSTRSLLLGDLLPAGAVLRGLILFNALFALQTGLDLAFLWGGVRLPDGMTYAEYAHRGAYPLIFAALLAGGFTLIATRAGGAAAGSRAIRWLSYLWTAQTVWLVISSALRLDLYVGVYGLSLMRVAAFVWMGLVALGLVLIVARLALNRSNAWLINAVLLSGLLTLYASHFVDIRALIARHNLAVSREMGGPGQPLDIAHLCRLGPAALPALRAAEALDLERPMGCAAMVEARFRSAMAHWSGHTLQNRRILAALDGAPSEAASETLDLSYRDLDNRAYEEPWP